MNQVRSSLRQYDRASAIEYSHRWALKRNPEYYDFSNIGGDCTNFISQCIYAGSRVMNYKTDLGWYYINANNRSPSWTGVKFLYNFLLRNTSDSGPVGTSVPIQNIAPGDIIQLAFNQNAEFSHSLFVVQSGTPPSFNNILINTHTIDRQYYPLSNYRWNKIRFIKISGVIY
ncbi:MAG: amidase domain-containing protein [Clostridia bacterium]|nr:amidase domain-containing protein [Clostridia bacterium]